MGFADFSLMSALFMLVAGIGAGFVGYAVGVSSLVSYPALLALGIPPVIANASNTLGVIGTGIGGCLGARKELKKQKQRAITELISADRAATQGIRIRCATFDSVQCRTHRF